MSRNFYKKNDHSFSPENIRERYNRQIERLDGQSEGPILDLAKETIRLMGREGKSRQEIEAVLKNRFRFPETLVSQLMEDFL